jgi:type I restriction enzyme M protein
LKGGIPNRDIDALEPYWKVCPSLRSSLFAPADRTGYAKLNVAQQEVKHIIFSHPEFTKYAAAVENAFRAWQEKNDPILRSLAIGAKPKEFLHTISEDILACFTNTELIDRYDIYQHLMSYWYDIMQDDVYLIATDGWKAEPAGVMDDKGKPKKNEWECDLIPKQLVLNRYFAEPQKKLNELTATMEDVERQMAEMIEEQGGDEGLLESVLNEKGNITKGDLKSRMKEIQGNAEFVDELKALKSYRELMERESELKSEVKKLEKDLDAQSKAKYGVLTENEIKELVVEDKWKAALALAVKSEMDRISQRLTQRIKELAERYAIPLPALINESEALTKKVDEHLAKMGFTLK